MAASRNSAGRRRVEERRMRLLWACASAELGEIALALLRKAFGWEIEKWDLRQSVKTEANSLGEEQLETMGKEEDEEKEPATERRKEYTNLESDVGER